MILAPEHIAHLRSSGLSDETIELARLYTLATPNDVAKALKRKRWERGGAIAIPFFLPGEQEPAAVRVRPDCPRVAKKQNGEEREIKYDQPHKSPSVVYFPPLTIESRLNGDDIIVWTEGEKKALVLDQIGYCAIGLTGVWNAHDAPARKAGEGWKLHPWIREHVRVEGREHVIAYDSDAAENEDVIKAARVLARMLRTAGASDVRMTAIPSAENGSKRGIDDHFVACGEAATHELIANAATLVDRDDRPVVHLSTDEHRHVETCIRYLAECEHALFQRAGALVQIVDDPERHRGARKIGRVDKSRLATMLTRHVRFFERNEDGDMIAKHPPQWLTCGILAELQWPGIRVLRGLTEVPMLRPDGTVLDVPGYDEPTRVLYEPAIKVPPIPSAPTRDDARRACAALLDVFCEFPFAAAAHRSVALSAVLSYLARPAIDGPVPMHFVEANVRGTGKSLLCDVITLIATGASAERVPPTHGEEEWRKRLLAILLAAKPLVLIDNVRGTFESAALDALLTGTSYSDRVLGKSEDASIRDVRTIWLATGNNADIAGDLARRMLLCRLQSPLENPEERADLKRDEDGLRRYVLEHRGELVAAGLTILRAWIVAGRPKAPMRPMGSFAAYSSIVRQAIVWCGEPDPGDVIPEIRERSDRDGNLVRDLFAAWHAVFGVSWTTTAEAIRKCWPKDGPSSTSADAATALRDQLAELCRTKGDLRPSAVGLGKRLKTYERRLCAGLVLESDRDRERNATVWRVVSSGDAGGTGDNPYPPAGAPAPAPAPAHTRADASGTEDTSGISGISGHAASCSCAECRAQAAAEAQRRIAHAQQQGGSVRAS